MFPYQTMAGLTGQYMEERGLKPWQSDFKVYILNSWTTLLAGGYYSAQRGLGKLLKVTQLINYAPSTECPRFPGLQ